MLAANLFGYHVTSVAKMLIARLAIFITSTYGERDPSDNFNELHARLGSNYRLHNRVTNVVTSGFDRLDAICLMAVGRADDSNDPAV